jgi:predicted metal-dependent hydrolase
MATSQPSRRTAFKDPEEVHAPQDGHPAKPRRARFDWSDTSKHWVPDDPFTTHVINVLHLLLPAGERWFVDVVNKARPLVNDEELQETIKPFVQQEAWHAWAHTMVLEHLADQGIDTKPYTDRLENQWFRRVLGDHPSWPSWMQRWWLNRRLAVVAGIEHYTCVLGQWILENEVLEEAGADPVMLDLLRWHGAEEVEHRSLVFDVHSHLSGSRLQRATTMAEVVFFLSLFWVLGVRYLMRHDPSLSGAKPRWRDWFRAARQGRLPGPGRLYGAAPRYIRPSHHPITEGSTEMAMVYLARSPAAQAAEAAAS